MPDVINIAQAFDLIPDHWHPRIAGALNDSYIKLAKLQGEFVWHQHEHEDELFLVVRGTLTIKLRGSELVIRPGEFVIIPHGVQHCPVAEEEVWVLLMEPKTTRNTGDVTDAHTVEAEWLPGFGGEVTRDERGE